MCHDRQSDKLSALKKKLVEKNEVYWSFSLKVRVKLTWPPSTAQISLFSCRAVEV